jgi:hypothetical protein
VRTVGFGDNLSNGIQTLLRCAELNFDLNKNDGDSSKHIEMAFNPTFGLHAAWDGGLRVITNRQPELSDSAIENLEDVLVYEVSRRTATHWGEKSRPSFLIFVLIRRPVLLHDKLNILNYLLKQ